MPRGNFRAFAVAIRAQWFAAMSGGFSVPFAAFSAFSDSVSGRVVWGVLAASAFAFSAYRFWATEHDRVLELEEKLRPKISVLELHESITSFASFERTIELEIQNNSGEELNNCLAKVTHIKAEKFDLPDGSPASDWNIVYNARLPMALRTRRNSEREGNGPFNLRPGEKKKIPLCSRIDGERSDLKMNYETDSNDELLSAIRRCEVEVHFYGASAPTTECVDIWVNDRGELRGCRRAKN